MRSGVLLLGEHPPDQLIDLVRRTEDLGYDVFWYADEKFYRDCYVGLALAAVNTRSIRIGVCVTDPYSRHPALTTVANATLAELAPGRVILGIGAGGSGFPAMEIEREKPVVAIREAIELVRELLAGETVDYRGEIIRFDHSRLNFAPRSDIPIYIGTMSKLVLRLSGATADGIMIGGYASRPGISQSMVHIREGAGEAGRDLEGIEIISRVNVCTAEDRESALRTVKPMVNLSMWFAYPNFERFFDYNPDAPEWQLPRELLDTLVKRDYNLIPSSAHLIPDELVKHRALAGTVADVVQGVVDMAHMGITQITIFPMPLEGEGFDSVIETFAVDVMPQVRSTLGCVAEPGRPCGWTGTRCTVAGCQRSK
jgi:5,10-methylenetetrahydromethanopterin reductase